MRVAQELGSEWVAAAHHSPVPLVQTEALQMGWRFAPNILLAVEQTADSAVQAGMAAVQAFDTVAAELFDMRPDYQPAALEPHWAAGLLRGEVVVPYP